jgi:hypothetical protein
MCASDPIRAEQGFQARRCLQQRRPVPRAVPEFPGRLRTRGTATRYRLAECSFGLLGRRRSLRGAHLAPMSAQLA